VARYAALRALGNILPRRIAAAIATSVRTPADAEDWQPGRCTDDGVEGRIVWSNGVAVKIEWTDGEKVMWKRDSLAGRPIELLDAAAESAGRAERKEGQRPRRRGQGAGRGGSPHDLLGADRGDGRQGLLVLARRPDPDATLYSAIARDHREGSSLSVPEDGTRPVRA
jgi:hypothetical protein